MHTCDYNSCNSAVYNGYSYCDKHLVNYENIPSDVCSVENCIMKHRIGSLYCDFHKCRYIDCVDLINEDNYCIKHTIK